MRKKIRSSSCCTILFQILGCEWRSVPIVLIGRSIWILARRVEQINRFPTPIVPRKWKCIRISILLLILANNTSILPYTKLLSCNSERNSNRLTYLAYLLTQNVISTPRASRPRHSNQPLLLPPTSNNSSPSTFIPNHEVLHHPPHRSPQHLHRRRRPIRLRKQRPKDPRRRRQT